MNRADFIAELAARLERLPASERDDAINYYEEYFNEAGPQREKNVIDELGSPAKTAAQILAEYSSGYVLAPAEKKAKAKKINNLNAIILGILTAPITLPLAIGALALLFSVIVSAGAVAFSFLAVSFACVASGVITIAIGCFYPGVGFATGMVAAGNGMMIAGMGILIFIPSIKFAKSLGYFITKAAAKIFNKIAKRNKESEARHEKIQ